MLPDTELICGLGAGLTLCDAGAWHALFVAQTLLVLSLALTNATMGVRHTLGWLGLPLWVARRFTSATLLAGVVPLVTGLWLRQQVKDASLACYLEHAATGCRHDLLDRAQEMQQVAVWVGWTEAVLIGTSLVGLALLRPPSR